MKSYADVITYERKGFLYLNDNGSKRGWGKKGRSGLLAKFEDKPKLSPEQFLGLSSYKDNLNPSVNYGKEANINDQIAAFGDTQATLRCQDFIDMGWLNPTKV